MNFNVQLPAGWSSKRLKYVASHNDDVLSEDTDELKEIDYVEISGVSLSGGIEEINRMTFFEAPSRARRKVRKEDILISTVRTYLKAIATVGDASDDLVASTGFCVVRSRGEANAGFLGWVAKSEPFVSEVVARSVGVSYPAINASELVNINVPLPPLETQRRIALFLDEKTARIDALIAKKRALLDRLADKRQALITRAVTKGLSPDAPMKPSGIDWLGNIPAHWETAPLRWYLRTASGDGSRNEDVSVERTEADAIPVIGGNGLMGFTTSSNSSNSALVIGRVGALCGNVHPVAEPSWVTDNALKVYGIRGFVSFYLLQALKVRDLNVLASRNAQPLMTGEIVKAQIMPRPPIEEQAAIGAYVCAALDLLDRESNQITQSVELLREYRAATITAAVTAKIAPENVSEQGA